MTKTEQYIFAKHNQSKWHYIGVNEMIYDIRSELTKDQVKDEIRELRKAGKIDLCQGLNGWLIKVIEKT
ncbi:MAG TPA: hypothetical protein DCS19_01285 [Flavobacterium sp.]|nr:hypothetical protein [Flavobacterium sp.]